MSTTPGPTSPSRPYVLICDDNAHNAELLAAFLEPLGVETSVAWDGEHALRAVAQRTPDLILLDVMMPRVSGYQVCRRLKEADATRAIPVIIVTALDAVADVEHARELGADAFLTKPVDRETLIEAVRARLPK